MFALGTSVVSEEVAESRRLEAGVSASPTVMAIGAVAVLSRVERSATLEMVGGVWAWADAVRMRAQRRREGVFMAATEVGATEPQGGSLGPEFAEGEAAEEA
jgi:hypothetical protein